jgi:hypothetical protein
VAPTLKLLTITEDVELINMSIKLALELETQIFSNIEAASLAPRLKLEDGLEPSQILQKTLSKSGTLSTQLALEKRMES